jgi:hypothetical protein
MIVPRTKARLRCLALISAALLPGGIAPAQTADPAPPQDREIVVSGTKLPAAEAPKSATCEALARDPHFKARMEMSGGHPLSGPRISLPTRMPRNPDYAAPPLTPVGSALPVLPKSRFGVNSAMPEELPEPAAHATAGESALGDEAVAQPHPLSRAEALALCRAYQAAEAGTGRGRTERARRDTTLPMAFALFDQRRFRESLLWFRKASDKLPFVDGGDEAALFIGKLYLQGLGPDSDPVEGVKWLKKAAEAPFNPITQTPVFDPRQPERNTAIGEAAVILGNLYSIGHSGVPKDPGAALKWYERAFEVGHIAAAKKVGDLHYEGIGTKRDVKKAASWYRKAAKFDHAPAQIALADILYLGEDEAAQDLKEALAWYRAAARYDHPAALYALGRAYEAGEGVPADGLMALGFYKSAALRGSAAAKMVMGSHFYEGRLLPKDHALARGWFEEAAAGGDPEGMYNLSAMLARGEGGARDLARAWALMKGAAALGHLTAPKSIAALEERMSAPEKQAAAAMLASGSAR